MAGFCIVASLLLFVSFVRLLSAICEDVLVEHALDGVDEGGGPTGTVLDLTMFLWSVGERSHRWTAVCRECGALNATDGGRCGPRGAGL